MFEAALLQIYSFSTLGNRYYTPGEIISSTHYVNSFDKFSTFRMLTVDSKLFVSVMAGITLKSLHQSLSNIILEPRIIRAHPNTPAMVGCGCAVYSLGEGRISDWKHQQGYVSSECGRLLFNT